MCWVIVLAREIQFPDQGLNAGPLHWERGLLATRLDYQGNSWPCLMQKLMGTGWQSWIMRLLAMGPQRISELMLAHWHGEGAELGSVVSVVRLGSQIWCWHAGGWEQFLTWSWKLLLACWWVGCCYQDHVEKDQMRWEIHSVHLWKL